MLVRAYRSPDAQGVANCFYDSVHGLGLFGYGPRQIAAWAPARPDPAAIDARAADGRLTLVAVDEADGVLGFGEMEADGHIDRLYRRPEPETKGVGAAILDKLIAEARAQGLDRLWVEASELARPLFARRGFRLVERRDFEHNGVPIHNFAMELRLE